MGHHNKAKPDIKMLYEILESGFPNDTFKVYRVGGNKQYLAISNLNTTLNKVYEHIQLYRPILEQENIYQRIDKINGTYFEIIPRFLKKYNNY